jgi:AraC family transcriptional regulator
VPAPFRRIQPAIALAATHPDGDVPLAALAARAGLSPFHLHRIFSDVTGQTPKQFTLRLRVSRAASLLLAGRHSVLKIALACGFRSHEAFTRAFRREFGMTPRAYRARGFAGRPGAADARLHAAIVRKVGPCLGLFHVPLDESLRRHAMSYSIERKDFAAQPVLVVRRRVKRSDIASTIGAVLPSIFQYAQQRGMALTGHPFTRYIDVGHGLLTIEPGMRVSGPGHPAAVDPSADAVVVEDTLPAGPAVTTVHAGPYETLNDAYAALEAWIEAHGLTRAGAPWESYITDPGEYPDPKDWRTEVCWPIR